MTQSKFLENWGGPCINSPCAYVLFLRPTAQLKIILKKYHPCEFGDVTMILRGDIALMGAKTAHTSTWTIRITVCNCVIFPFECMRNNRLVKEPWSPQESIVSHAFKWEEFMVAKLLAILMYLERSFSFTFNCKPNRADWLFSFYFFVSVCVVTLL